MPADGWNNLEDLQNSFILGAPGTTAEDLNGGEPIEIVGVVPDVLPVESACEFEPADDVEHTPQAFIDHLVQRPELRVTPPEPTEVGGLSGLRVDVSLADDIPECLVVPACSSSEPVVAGRGRGSDLRVVAPSPVCPVSTSGRRRARCP